MKRWMVKLAPLVVLLLAGCGSTGQGPADTPKTVERGPQTLKIEADPNGLWWDDDAQTLFIADDDGNRILQWTDDGGFAPVAELPAAPPDGAGLGQLVRTEDGTLVVTRFGGGKAGDVIYVPASGKAEAVPGLDPERRRIGLTVTEDGQLFDAWFVKLATGERAGSIGKLSLSGTESEVIKDLKKPIGVLAMGTDLFVSDQDLGQILKAPRSDPSKTTVVATLEKPDLLAAGPGGSIFAGSAGGSLYRITASGAAEVFKPGFQQVRGVAYDPTNHRVFAADHDADESDGVSNVLHILPVD